MKKFILIGAAFFPLLTHSQAWNSARILLEMQKLAPTDNVLYIAAHPDDENTRLLAYLANEKKFRTGYLALTRGDGGQNLIGKEQGDALGVIRTQELLAARRIDGAEQFFTRANDFGYSKNPEETLRTWNHDSILSDVVLAIRKFRPALIICRFPTTGEGGHGHHTASAMLALEAFDAAADESRFSWQLKLYPAWRTRSIVWNTFNFGGNNTTSPDQIQVDVGGYNPLLGKSYGEVAAESRSMHKSQGFGSAPQRGSVVEYFKFLKGDSLGRDLFKYMSGDLSQVLGNGALESCIAAFDPRKPAASVPALVSLYRQVNSLGPQLAALRTQKLRQLQDLIVACSGLWLEASTNSPSGTTGSEALVKAEALLRNPGVMRLKGVHFSAGGDTAMNSMLTVDRAFTMRGVCHLSDSMLSTPYWLREAHGAGQYVVRDARLIGLPEKASPVNVVFDVEIEGFEFNLRRDAAYKSTDPVKGEVIAPFEVLPPLTLSFPDRSILFTASSSKSLALQAQPEGSPVNGTLQLSASDGWNAGSAEKVFKTVDGTGTTEVPITISPGPRNGTISASCITPQGVADRSITRITYDHIPHQVILQPAQAKLVTLDLRKRGTHIGYIPGAGDDVGKSLAQAGYQVTMLEGDLAGYDLSKFDAIVTGVRAYNTNTHLLKAQRRLLEYVKNGGNLVVQYNTNSRVGPLNVNIGPWPFTISRDRVTDENAEVVFLDKSHPLLNTPNKITAADFEGWVQERGIYFAADPDPHYQTVISMADPGEKASAGSLIVGAYGKGNFVYTGLAFFRQLPAGNAGAYRLFANLLALKSH